MKSNRLQRSGSRLLSPLPILLLTVFIDMVGFGIVIPVLPLYAERFGASPRQFSKSWVANAAGPRADQSCEAVHRRITNLPNIISSFGNCKAQIHCWPARSWPSTSKHCWMPFAFAITGHTRTANLRSIIVVYQQSRWCCHRKPRPGSGASP